MKSKRFTLNEDQVKSIKRALVKYTLPLLLAFLIAIQAGYSVKDALLIVYSAVLTMAINVLTKFVPETKK